MNIAPINLKEKFGDKYKVRYEDSYYAQYGENARTVDPWYMILLCQHGHIFPCGGTRLAASATRMIGRKLLTIPGTEVKQDGDDGMTVVFECADIQKILRIMRPKKVRKLSPEQKAAAIERLAQYRQAQNAETTQGTHGTALDDQTHQEAHKRPVLVS